MCTHQHNVAEVACYRIGEDHEITKKNEVLSHRLFCVEFYEHVPCIEAKLACLRRYAVELVESWDGSGTFLAPDGASLRPPQAALPSRAASIRHRRRYRGVNA